MNIFRTVHDFVRARGAFVVTCRNCDHTAFISARFLKERFYAAFSVADANFRCRLCGRRNVKLAAAAKELAVTLLDPRDFHLNRTCGPRFLPRVVRWRAELFEADISPLRQAKPGEPTL